MGQLAGEDRALEFRPENQIAQPGGTNRPNRERGSLWLPRSVSEWWSFCTSAVFLLGLVAARAEYCLIRLRLYDPAEDLSWPPGENRKPLQILSGVELLRPVCSYFVQTLPKWLTKPFQASRGRQFSVDFLEFLVGYTGYFYQILWVIPSVPSGTAAARPA